MTSEPRLAPLAIQDLDGDLQDLTGASAGRSVPDIVLTLARHPALLKAWKVFRDHILDDNSLPFRDREIAILRALWRCGGEYGWGPHVVTVMKAGFTDDEVRAIADDPEALAGLSDWDRLLLRGTDELRDGQDLSEETWQALAERYDDRQLLDFVFTVCQYVTMAAVFKSVGLALDPATPRFPA